MAGMTVGELIVALQTLPQNAIVAAEGYDQSCFDVLSVIHANIDRQDEPRVVIRTDTAASDDLYWCR
jgi:hypothetical protein